MKNEDLLRKWLIQVWIENDFRGAEQAFSPETETAHIAGELKLRANDYETMVGAICANFRPEQLELSNIIEQDNKISAQMTLKGHRLDSEAEASLNVYVYREIKNGKFVGSASYPDYIAFYTAMGQLPPDMVSTLMMGGSLHE